jgi:transposase InsO family protein
VFAGVITKLKTVLASAAKAMREALRPRPCSIVSGLVTDLLRSRAELAVENVLLRQQLIVAGRRVKRPVFRRHERTLVTLLAAALPRWRDALLLVKPETVLRWHREGFRLLWRWKSRPKTAPAPRISSDVIELIQRMATENRLWGAERVRGELIKLGIHVAKRTVQRHMRDRRDPAPPRGQNWHTFLRNHIVWACDFLQVYDVWFRPIFAFFIVDINAKQVVHVCVTRHPTAQWTAQQIREATPFGVGPEFIIRDNDGKFGADFDRAAKGAGISVLRTAVQAPLMNSVCERLLGEIVGQLVDLSRQRVRGPLHFPDPAVAPSDDPMASGNVDDHVSDLPPGRERHLHEVDVPEVGRGLSEVVTVFEPPKVTLFERASACASPPH